MTYGPLNDAARDYRYQQWLALVQLLATLAVFVSVFLVIFISTRPTRSRARRKSNNTPMVQTWLKFGPEKPDCVRESYKPHTDNPKDVASIIEQLSQQSTEILNLTSEDQEVYGVTQATVPYVSLQTSTSFRISDAIYIDPDYWVPRSPDEVAERQIEKAWMEENNKFLILSVVSTILLQSCQTLMHTFWYLNGLGVGGSATSEGMYSLAVFFLYLQIASSSRTIGYNISKASSGDKFWANVIHEILTYFVVLFVMRDRWISRRTPAEVNPPHQRNPPGPDNASLTVSCIDRCCYPRCTLPRMRLAVIWVAPIMAILLSN